MCGSQSLIWSDWILNVLYKDYVAEGYCPEDGTPQEGIWSVLLWMCYLSSVAEAAEECFSKPSCLRFGDNVAIVVHDISQELGPLYHRCSIELHACTERRRLDKECLYKLWLRVWKERVC